MTKKKGLMSAGGLFMLLVVGLGLIGIVNGLWSKNLVVEGTVTTGDLNADWDCAWTNDDGLVGAAGVVGTNCGNTEEPSGDIGLDPRTPGNPWRFPYSDPFVAKDVGECHVNIDPDEPAGEPDYGAQVATIVLSNAYPSYECSFVLLLSNTGSIPFNIIGGGLQVEPGVPVEAYGDCDLEVGKQVDPGQEELLSCTLHVMQEAGQSVCTGTTTLTAAGNVAVEEDCPEATLVTYTATAKVCVAQWNEAATFRDCVLSNQHEGPGGVFRVESGPMGFSSTGWGGWSCPAGSSVVGGGYEPASAIVAISEAAQPGSVSGLYPVYPHWTFTPPETGWVVQNDDDLGETLNVFALCLPD